MSSVARDIAFKHASPEDWLTIHSIAHRTWPVAYGDVISVQQLTYMLALIYSQRSIRAQMEVAKHVFYLGYHSTVAVGFISIETHCKTYTQLMIHKLYVLPEFQGKGVGQAFIRFITELALATGHEVVCLKVFHQNRKGIEFYTRSGFSVCGEERTTFGNAYEVLDYVMSKSIRR